MNQPLISIIVPVYKVEQYIHICVDSVLNQTYSNWELILVDDGSPDNCPQICDEYAATDKRIRVIHKENGGLSDARNFGIKVATGDYLLFLDSDDYWRESDFLHSIYELILFQPDVEVINFGMVKYYPFSDKYLTDKRNFLLNRLERESNGAYIKRLLQNDLYIASACNKCVKRLLLIENHVYFEKGIRSEDMDWCGQILYLIPIMTCINKKPYVYRQQRVGSITSYVDVSHLNDILQMIKIALQNSINLNPQDRYVYLSFYAVQYLTLLFNLNSSMEKVSSSLTSDIYELRGILDNDLNYKVKIANKFMRFFSFKLMTKVLRLYVSIKQR